MKHRLIVITTGAALFCIQGVNINNAFAAEKEKAEIQYMKNGGYKAVVKEEDVTPAGTLEKTVTGTVIDVENNGTETRQYYKNQVRDPKGMMNKKTDNSLVRFVEKPRGGYRQITERKINNAAGNDVTYVTVTDVDVDIKGNVTTTAKTTKTVNPKGLMNEKSVTTESKSLNNEVIYNRKKTD